MNKRVDVDAYHRLFGRLAELADFGAAAVATVERVAAGYRALTLPGGHVIGTQSPGSPA